MWSYNYAYIYPNFSYDFSQKNKIATTVIKKILIILFGIVI